MTIFERLAALQAEIDALKSAPAQVPDTSALEARVTALETEVGTPPADPSAQ